MGGYREGSGRSKTGYYKGIYCGSTYELCWVIYNIDHGIKFTRFNKRLEKDGIVYYPDFLLDDNHTIIEIKGYECRDKVERKTKLAQDLGYKVIVLRKDDLLYVFEYVAYKYKTKHFATLYDGYKPQFNYTCANCGTVFGRDKRLGPQVFCGAKCAGKFRFKINKSKFQNAARESGHQFSKGRRSETAVFTKEKALEIFHSTKSIYRLGRDNGVTSNTIWCIKRKKTYKWIHKMDE